MWFADRSHEGDIYNWYMKMNEISLRTFEKNLAGDWEFIFYNEEVENIQNVLQEHFFKIYDLWKSEPCNILYCGPDNLVMKPTEVFGKYDQFMMFNYTDPKSCNDKNKYNLKHEHFFNADVRYFPHTMSEDIWQLGAKMASDWDFDCWNTEQIILNEMLWKQPGRTIENTLDATMAYQGFYLFEDDWDRRLDWQNAWNGIHIADANIIHLHGSRNAEMKFELMEQLEEMAE